VGRLERFPILLKKYRARKRVERYWLERWRFLYHATEDEKEKDNGQKAGEATTAKP
jgi:hypothetical protein